MMKKLIKPKKEKAIKTKKEKTSRQQKAIKKRTRRRIMHALTAVILVVTLLFGVFRFSPVSARFIQAVKDLCISVARYVLFLFGGNESLIAPSVNIFPADMDTILPLSWEELQAFFVNFWALFKNTENIKAYFAMLGVKIGEVAEWLMYMLLPGLTFFLCIYISYQNIERRNSDDIHFEKFKAKVKGELPALDSPFLIGWKKVRRRIILPMKNHVKTYFGFLQKRSTYLWLLGFYWAYNLNLFTIVIEAAAWVFHFTIEIDFGNIFIQIAKFSVDFSVLYLFLPKLIRWYLIYKIFHFLRCRTGDKRIMKYWDKNEEYVEAHPGGLFIVGKQRSKKTSLLVTLKRIYEQLFRKRAQKKLAARDKQFPFFPWQIIEQTVERCRKDKTFIVFEDMENFASMIKSTWNEKGMLKYQAKVNGLRKLYGFEFDYFRKYAEEYPLTYDNGRLSISIFEAIERYAQLYFIYSQRSTLDASNLSIREDFEFKDYGNFPIFDGNPLRKTKDSEKNTQYSHIIPYEAFRARKGFDPDTWQDVMIEYGIGGITEASKERKNRITRQQSKEDDDKTKGLVNQDNDGFDLDNKIRGHVATVDNVDFWVWLLDDQDENAMGADTRRMFTILMIKHTSDAKLILPFVALDEAICGLVEKIRDTFHYFVRNRKYKNTLLDYILNVIYQPFFRHFDRIERRYGVHTVTVKAKDALDDELLSEGDKLYIPVATTYNGIFATDSCRSYYRKRARKAIVSLDGREQYQGLHPSQKEYGKQKSFLHTDLSGLDYRKATKKDEPPEPDDGATAEKPVKRGRGRPKKGA